ncbi:hypothetical protein NL676_009954 [Syzygium grande]|nr:hypothetical protein NL676_009954 [Syzygium grande]
MSAPASTPLLDFLQRLQEAALAAFGPRNFDPKLYIDLSLKSDLDAVERAFAGLPRSPDGSVPAGDLERFIAAHLGAAGSDLVYAQPADFVPEPEGFLPRVRSPAVRAWALEVHALWRNLSRRVDDAVRERPDWHTLIPLPGPVIVPGSRFREVNYWDSYWIIRGLLVSKMYATAKAIVTNLIYLIEEYGHVLNGARIYYTNRRNPEDITTLETTSILPVDLNIHILRMELDISFFGKIAGNHNIATQFLEASKARERAVSTVFWNERMGQWLDYWLGDSSSCAEGQHWAAANQNQNVFASNFVPLWMDVFNSDKNLVEKVAKSLQSSGLLHAAGIACSLTNSGQQWDFPNGWAPLQHMIAEGLARSGSSEARSLAEDIIIRWIRTNYVTYKKTGTMHEKYDVRKCGAFGGGGEYIPQTGFGWSNGVVLAFLEEFGWPEDRKIDCEETKPVKCGIRTLTV